jgi:hypothetical protein
MNFILECIRDIGIVFGIILGIILVLLLYGYFPLIFGALCMLGLLIFSIKVIREMKQLNSFEFSPGL